MFRHGLLIILLLCALPWVATRPATGAVQAGTMHYNPTSKQFQFFDGSGWFNLGIGLALGVCSTPGMLDYDPLILVSYKYCNGTNWIRVIGVPTLAFCSGSGKTDFRVGTFMVCNGLLWTSIKGFPVSS